MTAAAARSQPVLQPAKRGWLRLVRTYGWLVVCAVILLTSAWYIYPVAGGDSIFFMPVAWFYAHGQGLINPLVPLACDTDPLHLCRYCFHLPLFPWLVGSLASLHPTVRGLFMVAGLMSVAKLWLVNRELAGDEPAHRPRYWLFGGSMLLTTYQALPTSGRPEILSSLLILGIYATSRRALRHREPGYAIATVLLLGTLLACHFTGYYFTLLIVLVELMLRPGVWTRKLLYGLLLGVGSVGVGAGLIALSPNGFDTIRGIADHANRQLRGAEGLNLKTLLYWSVLVPNNFLFGVFVILSAGLYTRYVYGALRRKTLAIDRYRILTVVLLCLLGVLAGFYLFFLQKPNRIYDLTQFIGVMLIFTYHVVRRGRYPLRLAYGGLLALALVPFVRESILFVDHVADGYVYDRARTVFRQVETRRGPLAGTQGMWVLADDLNRFDYWEETPSSRPIVIEQLHRELPADVRKQGRLLYDWRTTDVRRLMGVPISNHPQGYSFSIWQWPSGR